MRAASMVVAVDLGAESGRVVTAALDGQQVALEVCHRFPNVPVSVRGTLYWDILYLWREIQEGIGGCLSRRPAAIGVDAWGVDFGLLDRAGRLIGNPVHYRDARTEGMQEIAFSRVPRRAIFESTGIQFMPINTLYQLLSMVEADDPLLPQAETFLTIPDLINYWLTGAKVCEFSNATTTQCYNPRRHGWAGDVLSRLGIPTRMFPPVVAPGTQLGAYQGVPVIAPACHDTGSAVATVPTATPHYAYLSSGTWSLLGLEVPEAVINEQALVANLTNEGGVAGAFRLLKNIMGLWIIQQCRATWAAAGRSYDYHTLDEMAREAVPFGALIDPDDLSFLPPGDMPARIAAFCQRTGQTPPDSVSATVRCVLESLALKYRYFLELLIAVSGQPVDVIHAIGGGSQNELLCQMTADATGRPVIAGPVEATALGNALVQWLALGEIGSLAEARALVRRSFELKTYEPRNSAAWEEAFERFTALLPEAAD
ncbi:MAG: rhamnulokinase family protein [Anaerolineae bacterium]